MLLPLIIKQKKKSVSIKKANGTKLKMLDGIKFVWIKTIKYKENDYKRVINMFEYSLKAYFIKNVLKDQPTHVIGSLMHPFAAITGARVAKRKKAFFIFEERDLWPQSMIDLGNASPTSFKVKMLRKIEHWLINSSDKTLLLFDKAQQYMLQNGVAKEKLMVVSNGVQLENYTNNLTKKLPEEVSAIYEKHAGKFIAVYTGAHGMANNLDMVLDAANELKKQNANDIHFIFLGDGVHKKELEKRKVEENIENVSFLSSIKKEYIPNFLSRADVGLLPLHDSPVFNWGISPNKMYDYMAAKLPVVILTDIEQDALHKENPSILIRKNQAENLVSLLSELQYERQKAKSLGEQGYQFILQHCTWQSLADDFLHQLEVEEEIRPN